MAQKTVEIEGIGPVVLSKRRGAISIRLSINGRGQIRVTLPYWVPYSVGVSFVRQRQDWVAEHRQPASAALTHGQTIGKGHRLLFEASPALAKPLSRVADNVVRVTHPAHLPASHPDVQQAAEKASVRALRSEAEILLPPRLAELAGRHGFSYRSVQVKQLTGRWGSCDAQTNIIFNLYLMQLPWTLIDYVILHELTHTQILRHGPDFWAAMRRVLPDVRVRRQAMRAYQPRIM